MFESMEMSTLSDCASLANADTERGEGSVGFFLSESTRTVTYLPSRTVTLLPIKPVEVAEKGRQQANDEEHNMSNSLVGIEYHGNVRGVLVDYAKVISQATIRGLGSSCGSGLLLCGSSRSGFLSPGHMSATDSLLADPSLSFGAVFSHLLATQGGISCAIGFVESVLLESIPRETLVELPIFGQFRLRWLVKQAFQAGYMFLFGVEVTALVLCIKTAGTAAVPLFLLKKLLQWVLCWIMNWVGRKMGLAVTFKLRQFIKDLRPGPVPAKLEANASLLLRNAQRELEAELKKPVVPAPRSILEHEHGSHGYLSVGECSICHDAAPRVAFLCAPMPRQAGVTPADCGFAHLFCATCVQDLFRRDGDTPNCPVCRQMVTKTVPLAEKKKGVCSDGWCLFTGPCLGCEEATANVLTVYSESKRGNKAVKTDYCQDCCNPKFPNYVLVSNFDSDSPTSSYDFCTLFASVLAEQQPDRV
eukprot:gb/GEZN01006607.1/.p1 GENE.gb/GEZN01006607.1/~~gb/GEZN01006607.1/.p1  ORF type:complete len:474 (+),score=48.22 gb/GEZN01006607.1/:91-1512(+)